MHRLERSIRDPGPVARAALLAFCAAVVAYGTVLFLVYANDGSVLLLAHAVALWANALTGAYVFAGPGASGRGGG